MNEDERKSKFHVHFGGIIIIIIIILVLANIDIKSKLQSGEFQKNITHIIDQGKIAINQYILNPLKIKTNQVFVDTTNKGIKQIQDNFANNVLKPVDINQ